MNSSKGFQMKNCLIVAIVLLLMLACGTMFDYQISLFLFDPDNIFGKVLAGYGQLPAFLCISIAGTLLWHTAKLDKQKQMAYVLKSFFGILLNILACLSIFMDPIINIQGMSKILSLLIAVLIVIGVDYLLLHCVKGIDKRTLNKIIIILIVVMFAEMIVINIIKIPWGRPRMRMISQTPEASFQPWWVIGSQMKEHLMSLGIAKEEFKSFPSGHSGNAACMMLLPLLPLINKKLQGKETLLFYIGFGITLMVAFSRIIAGAHFLSDVSIGIMVTFIIEIIFYKILFGNRERKRQ